jgi:ribonuclease HI
VRIEQQDAPVVEEFGESIGVATNNVAEYRGLLAASNGPKTTVTPTCVRSDSLLLVQQMLGNYKVKNPGLMRCTQEARRRSHTTSGA